MKTGKTIHGKPLNTILQRYLFRELTLSFLLTLSAVLCVMFVGALFQIVREFSGSGLGMIPTAAPILLAYILPYALVLAAVVSPTLTYGRLSAENELDAMRACGVPIRHAFVPVFLLAVGAGFGSWCLNEFAAPWAHYQRRIMIKQSIFRIMAAPPPGSNQINTGAYLIRYEDARDGLLINPYVVHRNKDGFAQEVFEAASGRFKFPKGKVPVLLLIDVRYDRTLFDQVQHGTAKSLEYPLESLQKIYNVEPRTPDLHAPQILERLVDSKTRKRELPRLATEFHDRYGRAIGVFLLVLLGAGVGTLTRKANRLAGLGTALPCVVGYLGTWTLLKGMGEKDKIPPEVAAYSTDGLLLLVLLYLVWRIFRR